MATSDAPDGKQFARCPECGGADFETIDTAQERVWFCVQCSAHLDANGNRVENLD